MGVTTFHQVGLGLTVFEHDELVEAPVKWLDSPAEVLRFVSEEDPSQWIVLARGGTTTFLTPALSAGVKGVMTLQGAPESHLGILSREFGIPCVMSVAFTEGVRSDRGEVIPSDGATVRIDVTGSPEGTVFIEDGAPTADADDPATAATPEMDPETAARMQALMTRYRTEIPGGVEGDRQMRRRLTTTVIETTDENVRRDLDPQETSDFLAYSGWNLWDLIAARQTEGESGLIPRQEYETVSFVQQWQTYARNYRRIEETIGVDGIVELGSIPRREIGTKVNHVHVWAAMCPLIGRAITTQLGLEEPSSRPEDLQTLIQFLRRMQHGLWGGGPGFVSARNYAVPVLEDSWLERFRDEEVRFEDDEALAAFRKFNATTELCGFLVHYDCRAGLCDTGPYPLPDGGFVIVRDHFIYEPAYEWASVVEGLPYAVTQVMFFRPDGPQEISINDIATTFASPRNYLKHLSGAVVYARDRWNSPISEVRRIDDAEMESIVERCNAAMTELYGTIGALSRDQRIQNGVKVYCREMMMPYARHAGLWDALLADGFDELAPRTQDAYVQLTGGSAQEVLGAVFIMGHGLVPDSGLPPAPPVDPAALPALHPLAIKGSQAAAPERADDLIDAGLITRSKAGYMLTEAGQRTHEQWLTDERASLDIERLGTLYDRFLSANGPMKAACAKSVSFQGGDWHGVLEEVTAAVARVEPALRRTAEMLARFSAYQPRLAAGLERANAGEWEFLTSTQVDSLHTVWMEIHEDYLQTLGRSREAEGSF
jgi:hypothetical protein